MSSDGITSSADYSGRKIASVDVGKYRPVTFNAEEGPGIQGVVDIEFEGGGGAHSGLRITVSVATRTTEDPTLSECRRAVLEAALALLKRAAEETSESLTAAPIP